MSLRLQLEYWKDVEWFVGRLPQVPGVFSQGTTLEELDFERPYSPTVRKLRNEDVTS